MKRYLIAILVLTTIAMPLTAFATEYPRFLTISGGGQGAAFFAVATSVAQLITDNLPIQANGQASNGGTHNLQLLAIGEVEMGMADNYSVWCAYNGQGVFENQMNTELRSIGSIYSGYFALQARKNIGIDTIADLKGKKVCVGTANSGTENVARAVLGAEGFDYVDGTDIIPEYVGGTSGTDLMRNRQADVMAFFAPIPDGVQTELVLTANTRLVSLSDAARKSLTAAGQPFVDSIIPAGTYRDQELDAQTVFVPMCLITTTDMDEQIVFEITKLIFENIADLRLSHNAFVNLTPEFAITGLVAPLHPGAERYYKEIGVIQ